MHSTENKITQHKNGNKRFGKQKMDEMGRF